MAIRLTGTDTNGVIANANGDWWITLAGELVANTGGAFYFDAHTDVTYSIEGTVISSAGRAIDSSHGAADFAGNQVLIAETGIVRSEFGAIFLRGTGNVVQNEGSVTATGGTASDAIQISGANGSITNIGTIQSNGSAMQIDGDDGSITNHGLAIGQDNAVFLNGDDGRVENHGTLRGTTQAILVSGGDNTILNAGTLVGASHAIEIYANATGDVTTIINTGTMQNTSGTNATVVGSKGNELIENEGHIAGYIELFDGDDRYVSMAGTLTGLLDMGAGDDLVVLGDSVLANRFDYDGGAGSDTLDLSDFAHAIWADLTYAGTEVWTRDNADWQDATGTWREIVDATDVENIVGTSGIDLMRGNDADNTFGYVGNSLITGVETIDGRGGVDTVDFSRADFAVWADLLNSKAWTQDDADATDSPTATSPWRMIAGISEIENLVGTEQVDFLRGSDADNHFTYLGSKQYAGIENIDGRGGSDTLDMSRFASGVWVDLGVATEEVWTQDDNDATDGGGNWRILADVSDIENIIGTDQRDLIRGDAGANVIDGGAGDDVLRGRGGLDTFVFTGNTFGHDTIEDFSADNGEKIDLSGVGEITDFADLLNSHLGLDGGHLTIGIGFDHRIHLIGWALADIGVGQALSADDFIF